MLYLQDPVQKKLDSDISRKILVNKDVGNQSKIRLQIKRNATKIYNDMSFLCTITKKNTNLRLNLRF